MNVEELQIYIERVREDEGVAWLFCRREHRPSQERSGELQCFDTSGARVLVIEDIGADETGHIPHSILRKIEKAREFCGSLPLEKMFAYSGRGHA